MLLLFPSCARFSSLLSAPFLCFLPDFTALLLLPALCAIMLPVPSPGSCVPHTKAACATSGMRAIGWPPLVYRIYGISYDNKASVILINLDGCFNSCEMNSHAMNSWPYQIQWKTSTAILVARISYCFLKLNYKRWEY